MGRASTDHAPGGHDLVNAAAGALRLALAKPRYWGFEALLSPEIAREATLEDRIARLLRLD